MGHVCIVLYALARMSGAPLLPPTSLRLVSPHPRACGTCGRCLNTGIAGDSVTYCDAAAVATVPSSDHYPPQWMHQRYTVFPKGPDDRSCGVLFGLSKKGLSTYCFLCVLSPPRSHTSISPYADMTDLDPLNIKNTQRSHSGQFLL